MTSLLSSEPSVKEGVLLRTKTTIGVGGPALFWAEPGDEKTLLRLLDMAKREALPVYIIGGGSNLLVADQGIPGLCLRLSRPSFCQIKRQGERMLCGSGAPLSKVIKTAIRHALSGLEALAGIPGSLGGAVMMNAGTPALSVGSRVREVWGVTRDGEKMHLLANDIQFSYRSSSLENLIITQVALELEPGGDSSALEEAYRQRLSLKMNTQPAAVKSAGCFFRNPPGRAAGELIDKAGCKGMEAGDAVVSTLHANYLVNRGSATANDFMTLAAQVRTRVKERFDIDLTAEVKIWP